MATTTNGIATRGDCNSIVSGAFSSDLTKCPTKAEIVAMGKLEVNNAAGYSENQCVKYSDLIAANVSILFYIESGYLYANITGSMSVSITFTITLYEGTGTARSTDFTIPAGAGGFFNLSGIGSGLLNFDINNPISPYAASGRMYYFNMTP